MIVLFSLFYIHNIIYLLSYLLFSILARHKKVNVILLRLSILFLHNCVKKMSEEIEKLFYYFSFTFKKKKRKNILCKRNDSKVPKSTESHLLRNVKHQNQQISITEKLEDILHSKSRHSGKLFFLQVYIYLSKPCFSL